MTPAARIAAAIEILDRYLDGTPAEKALTNWARRSRFAGSGDRAAIRDHVFTALRNRRSHAALGGAETGRGLMIGQLRANGVDPADMFTGQGHAPAPLGDGEGAPVPAAMSEAEACDIPDWLLPQLRDSLGDALVPVMAALQQRAPVFLRINARKADPDTVIAALAAEGITAQCCTMSKNALEVTENARRIANSEAYKIGLVELQDAGSQWVADQVPIAAGSRVLDYCAGGGGKTLALAARADAAFYAHDADKGRMRDLPERARRAGVSVTLLETEAVATNAPFDAVVCDVPCSGSGAWRRSPEGKWALTQARLQSLTGVQAEILDTAAGYVAEGGTLAYVTCSLLSSENADQIERFLARTPGWTCTTQQALTPLDGTDGFFIALLTRKITET